MYLGTARVDGDLAVGSLLPLDLDGQQKEFQLCEAQSRRYKYDVPNIFEIKKNVSRNILALGSNFTIE